MDRLSVKLAAALGLQLALALVIWAAGPSNTAFKAKDPLLSFDSGKIDGIEIDETGGNSTKLAKQDGKWVLPAFAGFPADDAKVAGLLKKLGDLKKGWPVASSSDAAKRFKVTDDAHDRRIVLKSLGLAIGEILIGTAPTFRQAYVRAGNDSHAYSASVSSHDAAVRGEDWMDRSLLNVPQDKIASIGINGVTLERKDGKFAIVGLGADEKPDETAIYRLVGALTYPAFDAVTGKGLEAIAKADLPDIEATIKMTDGAATVQKYKREAAGGAYIFVSSANNFVFRVSEAAIEPIVKAKRSALIEVPKKPEEAQAATQPRKPEAPAPNGG